MPPSLPPRRRTSDVGRALAGAAIFAAGLAAAATFTTASPAAPQEDCLPVVGCVTTALPSIPLPPVVAPTLPATTSPTSTSGGSPQGQPAPGTTTATTEAASPETPAEPAFSARASVRVVGRRARRFVEIRTRVTKNAHLTALLSRNGRALARKQFTVAQGSGVFRLRLGRGIKPGQARLWLTYRTASNEAARAAYRLRLPR
jgi:hypothetical protein